MHLWWRKLPRDCTNKSYNCILTPRSHSITKVNMHWKLSRTWGQLFSNANCRTKATIDHVKMLVELTFKKGLCLEIFKFGNYLKKNTHTHSYTQLFKNHISEVAQLRHYKSLREWSPHGCLWLTEEGYAQVPLSAPLQTSRKSLLREHIDCLFCTNGKKYHEAYGFVPVIEWG